jgi:hypothetical protein
MKLWIKTLFKDLLAISLLLTVFYFAGKSYLEMVTSKIRGTGDPIGIVSDLAYYPKRKLAGDEYIYNLTKQDDLYEGDEISSDSFSSIFMNLIDGTEISLENGSRIILKLSEDTIFFDGTISALSTKEREEPLKLINLNEKNPQPIILSASSEVTIRTDEKGVFNMSVLSGEVTRGVEVIEENEQIKIDSEGETQVNKLNFILSSPENNTSWITFDESLPLTFSWEEPVPQQSRSIYIAMDTSFNKMVYVQDDIQGQSFEIDLIPGEYFWRVGNEETQNFSSTGKVKVIGNTPLRAISPVDRTELTFRNQVPGETFRWQGGESADHWILNISSNQDMSDPVISEMTQYNQAKIDNLEEGEYWWQVRAVYNSFENIRELSSTQPYKLNITQVLEIAPSELVAPEEGTLLSPENLEEGIRFNWKGDDEIGRYELVISPNRDMTEPVFQDSTLKNYYIVSLDQPPGNYYWQVNAFAQNGNSLLSSEIRSFTSQEVIRHITLLFPEAEEPLEIERGGAITFKWTSSEKGNFRFRLWQLKGQEEKLITNSTIDPVEFTQYIPEKGDYLWQVDLLNSQNKVLLEGRKQSFYVEYPFLSPTLINPAPDSFISLIGEESLNIEWKPIPDSISYNYSLFYEDNDLPLREEKEYTATSIQLDTADLDKGTYTLELQANRLDEGKGFPLSSIPSRSVFNIDEVIIYESPVIINPVRGSEINRLQLLENGLQLRWSSSFEFPRYQINLLERETGNLLQQKLTNRQNFMLENLYPGNYDIEIRGMDSKNRMSPPGVTNITVNEVSALQRPVVINPTPGLVVDMSNRDTLDFSWTHSESDALFNISLSDNQGNTIFSRENYSDNNYIFRDLSKLDIGKFTFKIEAVKEYDDLGIIRSSPTITVPFEITIKTIEKAPVIISPEIQYAN